MCLGSCPETLRVSHYGMFHFPPSFPPYLGVEGRRHKWTTETLNQNPTVLCELKIDKRTIVLICFLWLRRQHYSLGTFKENKFMLAHGSVQGQGATSGGSCLAGSVLRLCEHHVAK